MIKRFLLQVLHVLHILPLLHVLQVLHLLHRFIKSLIYKEIMAYIRET